MATDDQSETPAQTPAQLQLHDAMWPDPYLTSGPLHCDDVSRLSKTKVQRVFFPRNEEDVVAILEFARRTGTKIGMRGTQHSMGAHCIAEDGFVIDMRCLRAMKLDGTLVTCGPGCRWFDLIQFLNKHGRSPRTMQSYCSFSVGGTLAVNAHGITTDYCFAESVVSLRLATASGEVLVCSRDAADDRCRELFSLVLGGYGLFGVIVEVTLKTSENTCLEMDSMQLSCKRTSGVDNRSEFERIYHMTRVQKHVRQIDESDLNEKDEPGRVEIKLARLNILDLDMASFYVFRKGYTGATISTLPLKPRGLTPWKRILYKWMMPAGKELRYALESQSGAALDWTQEDGASRNDLLYESAEHLAKLYEPLFVADDTFILQEFFVPASKFSAWLDLAKPIYKTIDENKHGVMLLNTTIRFIEQDSDTLMAYARVPEGVFAFVLYYRLPRTPEYIETEILAGFHNAFVDVTLQVGGTFYLPYRKCYSRQAFKTAYPMVAKFASQKEKYDPDGLFTNAWFQHYVLPECSAAYQSKFPAVPDEEPVTGAIQLLFPTLRQSWSLKSAADFPRSSHPDLVTRTASSYRSLMRDKQLRREFETQFLVKIFNIGDPGEILREMGKACWDPQNKGDVDIFRSISKKCAMGSGSPLTTLTQNFKALKQGSRQKQEFMRQIASLLTRLGWDQKREINGYVSIGDNGKMVLKMREALNLTGKVWVCHDEVNMPSQAGAGVVPAIVERGSIELVGEPVHFDLFVSASWKQIPDESADLVTINQGMHHIPPDERLLAFLQEVLRVLRPGGLFLFREHNMILHGGALGGGTDDLNLDAERPPGARVEMLDLAHSVFNAVTGVKEADEAKEVRAFRPLAEWREIMRNAGFEDAMLYEIEDEDCTWDEMVCFVKPGEPYNINYDESTHAHREVPVPPVADIIKTILGQIPGVAAKNLASVLQSVAAVLPKLKDRFQVLLDKKVLPLPIANSLGPAVDSFVKYAKNLLEKLGELFAKVEVKEVLEIGDDVIPREIFLVVPFLQWKEKYARLEMLEEIALGYVRDYAPFFLLKDDELEAMSTGTLERARSLQKQRSNTVSADISAEEARALLASLEAEGFEDADEGVPAEGSIPGLPSPAARGGYSPAPRVVKSERPPKRDRVAEVTGRIVYEELQKLEADMPGLMKGENMARTGFTLRQQSAVVSRFGGKDMHEAAENLAWYFTPESWQGFLEAIDNVVRQAKGKTIVPTKDRLFGNTNPIDPWHHVVLAFLSSPKVKFTNAGKMGLRMIGLEEIIELWEKAKAQRKGKGASSTMDLSNKLAAQTELLAGEQGRELRKLAAALTDGSRNSSRPREATYAFDQKSTVEIPNVGEILKAEFGYTSLTSRPTDITDDIRVYFEEQLKKNLGAFKSEQRARARSTEAESIEAGAEVNRVLGFLSIDEKTLNDMRSRHDVDKAADGLRKGLVQTLTLGQAGKNKFTITYTPLVDVVYTAGGYKFERRNTTTQDGFGQAVCATLKELKLAKDLTNTSHGEYTWYKLCEWLQVEIVEVMANSLNHTPWFRFPFMEFMGMYFEVLNKESAIVEQDYGFWKAYGSMAYLTDVIPGIVMTALFAQLSLLAKPIKMLQPDDGYAGFDQETFCEQVVLHYTRLSSERRASKRSALDVFVEQQEFWKSIDPQIKSATVLDMKERGSTSDRWLVVLETPPFKALGEILEKVALRVPNVSILEISGQREVQIRISIRVIMNAGTERTDELRNTHRVDVCTKLCQVPGCAIAVEYEYPKIGDVNLPVQVALRVQCSAIIDVMRTCRLLTEESRLYAADSRCEVVMEQMYDFWGEWKGDEMTS